MALYYAGIGSRRTPEPLCHKMTQYASLMEHSGMILRSGGAIGADSAFEAGVKSEDAKQIFKAENYTSDAMRLSRAFHPNWNALSEYAKRLMARNAMIILGEDLDEPVQMVIFWAPQDSKDGRVLGGTGHGIRIAKEWEIPCYKIIETNPTTIGMETV